jgi:hypothetical protein
MNAQIRNASKILVGKPELMRSLERLSEILKWVLKK